MPHSPLYHHYLTPGKFAVEFGPTVTSTAVATRVCGSRICASGRCLGTVSSFRSAEPSVQSTRPSAYAVRRLPPFRRGDGWAPVSVPRLSRRVSHSVSSVLGLDNLVVSHSSMGARARERGRKIGCGRVGRVPRRARTRPGRVQRRRTRRMPAADGPRTNWRGPTVDRSRTARAVSATARRSACSSSSRSSAATSTPSTTASSGLATRPSSIRSRSTGSVCTVREPVSLRSTSRCSLRSRRGRCLDVYEAPNTSFGSHRRLRQRDGER